MICQSPATVTIYNQPGQGRPISVTKSRTSSRIPLSSLTRRREYIAMPETTAPAIRKAFVKGRKYWKAITQNAITTDETITDATGFFSILTFIRFLSIMWAAHCEDTGPDEKCQGSPCNSKNRNQ